MKTMKVKKFVDWVTAKKDKVLSLSVAYYGEAVTWRPNCGVIIWDKGVSVGELYPDWTLEDALKTIKGGRVRLILSDGGEIVLRLRS
jgi:hypothetical protein